MKVRAAAVLPAAGSGRRLGGVRKAFLPLAGEPLLLHALRPFLAHPAFEWIVVAVHPEDAASPPAWLAALAPRVAVVEGGAERGESVERALAAVPEAAEVVVVHDAARPLVTRELVDRTVEVAARGAGAVAAVRATDTVKEVDGRGRVVRTLDRDSLWHAQTPQAFPRALLVEAYRRARADGVRAPDDAALVERCGGTVLVVEGSPENLKVTGPADLVVAEALLRRRGGEPAEQGGRTR